MGSLLLLALPFPWKDPAPSKARQDLGGIFQFTCICSLLQCHTIIPTHKAFFYIVTIPFLKKRICALWAQFCHLPPDTRRSNRLSDSQDGCPGGQAVFRSCLCQDTPPTSTQGLSCGLQSLSFCSPFLFTETQTYLLFHCHRVGGRQDL